MVIASPKSPSRAKPAKPSRPRSRPKAKAKASKPRAPKRLPLQMWTVTITEHRCERWRVPAQTLRVPAPTEDGALAFAIGLAHSRVSDAERMPGWRPLGRLSMKYTTAKKEGSNDELFPPLS